MVQLPLVVALHLLLRHHVLRRVVLRVPWRRALLQLLLPQLLFSRRGLLVLGELRRHLLQWQLLFLLQHQQLQRHLLQQRLLFLLERQQLLVVPVGVLGPFWLGQQGQHPLQLGQLRLRRRRPPSPLVGVFGRVPALLLPQHQGVVGLPPAEPHGRVALELLLVGLLHVGRRSVRFELSMPVP